MHFNKTIPELSVFDINNSKNFYVNILGAKIEYERKEDKFIFLSLEENQLMLEEIKTPPPRAAVSINNGISLSNIYSLCTIPYFKPKPSTIVLLKDNAFSHNRLSIEEGNNLYFAANELLSSK